MRIGLGKRTRIGFREGSVMRPVVSRTLRACRTVLIMALLIVRPVSGTSTASPQQGTAPSSDNPVLTFTSDVALVTVLIKPDKTADFEFVLSRLKEALQKSDKPERRQQAAGWHIAKATQPVQGNVVYIMRIDPVVKGEEYDITRLIAETFPVEVQEIFPKYRDAFAGRAITELTPLMSMKQ